MSEAPTLGTPLSLLSLAETRRYIRRSHAIMMTVTFVILYALGSMVIGGMLILANLTGGTVVQIVWGNGLGTDFWNYPGLLIIAPWGIVDLPMFATVSMVFVSIGVGIGMSVAVLLGIAMVRSRRASLGRPASVGSIAGLTPAMIALVTLGACCSTTAAATAGVGIVAHASGTTSTNLLVNTWYLGVFQMAVMYVALFAQELVLRVYGGILGLSGRDASRIYVAPPVDRRYVVGILLRVALMVGGITWSLAMLVDWTTTGPLSAPAALWTRWILEHQVPAFLAIVVALFPNGTFAVLRDLARYPGLAVRALLVAGGLLLLVGAPPPLAGWGLEGFGNELMGALGLPVAWGAVAPVYPLGWTLAVRWGLQYVLLGAFAISVGIAPSLALRPLRWTVGQFVPAKPAAAGPAPHGSAQTPTEPPAVTHEPASSVGAVADGP